MHDGIRHKIKPCDCISKNELLWRSDVFKIPRFKAAKFVLDRRKKDNTKERGWRVRLSEKICRLLKKTSFYCSQKMKKILACQNFWKI